VQGCCWDGVEGQLSSAVTCDDSKQQRITQDGQARPDSKYICRIMNDSVAVCVCMQVCRGSYTCKQHCTAASTETRPVAVATRNVDRKGTSAAQHRPSW
jgi:hypothetical protein